MTTKIDLVYLERACRAVHQANASSKLGDPRYSCLVSSDDLLLLLTSTPALIARIRELEAALVRAAELTESWVSCETQYDCSEDDPDFQTAQSWRALVCKGAVLP